MKIIDKTKQSEGRRIEFKQAVPGKSKLAKTIITFANDEEGEIFIGINDRPRKIIGLNSADTIQIKEQVNNIIFNKCRPIILPPAKT